MKNKKSMFIMVGVVLVIFGCACFFLMRSINNLDSVKQDLVNEMNKTDNYSDGEKFKKEYEEINGADIQGSEHKVKSLKIDKENPIKYSRYEEVMEKINNKENFVLYIGYPGCPWCRSAIPVLLDSAKKNEVKEILYLDIHNDKLLLVLDEDGKSDYSAVALRGQRDLIKFLTENDVYSEIEFGMNEDLKGKSLYSPTVCFIKEGKLQKFNVGTVAKQDKPYDDLIEEAYNELLNIYDEGFNSLK